MTAASQSLYGLASDSSSPTAGRSLTSNVDASTCTSAFDFRPDPCLTEHSVHIRTTKGVPWLTLTLKSRATEAKYLPLYCDRDVIRGSVTLELQKSKRLKAIVLKYRCEISGQVEDHVLDMEHPIWLPEDGAPVGTLLKGRHVIPISFPLPHEMPDPLQPGQMVTLPPSFREGGGGALFIDYMVSISLRKPGWSMSRKITSAVGYFPRSVCGAPSILRSLAYENGTGVPGPELDPSGWRISSSVDISRTLSDTKVVSIGYTLAVAEPLSFAVGGTIPVFLTVKGHDSQILDTAPSAGVSICLRRIVKVGRHPTSCLNISRAVFRSYRQRNTNQCEEEIHLFEGEIRIPKGTVPSFAYMNVILQYDIVLYRPSTAEFTLGSPPTTALEIPLLSESILVTAASPRHVGGTRLPVPPPAYA